MHAAELAAIVAELAPLFPASLLRSHMPSADCVVLEIAGRGRTFNLQANLALDLGRLHTIEKRPPNPPIPYGFASLLRARLDGAKLSAPSIVPGERLVSLGALGHGPEPTSPAQPYTLLFELTGSRANLFLLDEAGLILGLLRPDRLSKRGLKPQMTYLPPQGRGAPKPFESPYAPDPSCPFLPLNSAAARYYETLQAERRDADDAQRFARAYESTQARLTRHLKALQEAEEEARRADEFKHCGDLLRTHFPKLRNGQTSVALLDYASGETKEVALLPALRPQENIARYYQRAKKAERGLPIVLERRRKLLDELDHLERLAELAASGDPELQRRALDGLGLTKPAEHQKTKRQEEAEKHPPFRRFFSAKGREIRVGRSARENDILTFRLSKGADFWFHATGSSGAHVVVPGRKDEELDEETRLDAATLALHYAKSKAVCEVAYTRVSALRKPKRAPAGMVMYHEAKTLTLSVEKARLTRLMES